MSDDVDIRDLASRFRALGARDPEQWARSQVTEGINQMARYLFLRQAWRGVVAENDAAWIDRQIETAAAAPTAPFAGVGHAAKSLRDRGATDAELSTLVRWVQARALFDLCYLLEDPGTLEPDAADVAWRLFTVDADGKPIEPIGGLHESVLETDPMGREV